MKANIYSQGVVIPNAVLQTPLLTLLSHSQWFVILPQIILVRILLQYLLQLLTLLLQFWSRFCKHITEDIADRRLLFPLRFRECLEYIFPDLGSEREFFIGGPPLLCFEPFPKSNHC